MYEINHELRWKVQDMNGVDYIPFFCVSCGRAIVPRNGMIPIKCPHCGTNGWED